MTTSLVTGATGFIGSHLVRRLIARGDVVHVVVRPESDLRRLHDVTSAVTPHRCAIEQPGAVCRVVQAIRPDRVFHLEGAGVVGGVTPGAERLVAANVLGAIHLVDACAQTQCQSVVMTGDSFEYAPSALALRESDAGDPLTFHGLCRLAATQYGVLAAATRNLPIVMLRLFSAYGPGDNPRRLIPTIFRNLADRRPLLLASPGIVRDWIYIADLVALYLEAADRATELSGRIFNAGTGIATTLSDLVDAAFVATQSSTEVCWGAFPSPAHDATPWVADMRSTYSAFTWRPSTSLREGLALTLASLVQTTA